MSGRDATPELSVVVPVRDEADSILPLVDEIVAALEGSLDYEIVYVDDGSVDTTADRLREAKGRTPRLRVVRHRRACGQSAALGTGFRAARAPWVATLDGDGQNDPADILALLALAKDPVRLVGGERKTRRDPWSRRVSSRVANAIRGRLLGDGGVDNGCGLKVIHRETFLALPFFDHMHRFLPALVLREGFEIRSVSVRHRPRTSGRSHYGLLDRLFAGVVDLLGVLWLSRRARTPEVEDGDECARP